MGKTLQKTGFLIAVLLIVIIVTGVAGAIDILAVEEIEPGMTGIGKTVFKGTKVESFSVEIVSILKDQGINKDLILIKTGGEQINEIGGITAGMSGSPVYINDKLVGAIGYSWQFSDHHYCLVTPIADMLKLFEKSEGEINSEAEANHKLSPLKTPLMVSGLNGRALKNLQDDLSEHNFNVVPSGGKESQDTGDDTLEPGSAIAVELVRGDINIASLGTLTYVDDNKILAFGHPFTNKGEVNFFLSKAYINGVIPSVEQPFKLGSPSEPLLGMIHTDRSAGLAGKLGDYPEIIPLQIIVRDQARDVEKRVQVQIIKNELFVTPLASNIVLQAIDSTLDRIGKGTAWVDMKLMGNGLPDIEIEKEEIYYSQNDIASRSLADFYQVLNLIISNPFKKVNLINIELEVNVSKDDQIALVQEAKVLNKEVKPGDTLNIEVTLHPYRQETFTKMISVDLPEDITPGLASIVINGGFAEARGQEPAHNGDEDFDYETKQTQIEGYKNFKSMINDFLEGPDNNDLVVQVYPGYQMPAVPEEAPSSEAEEEGEEENESEPRESEEEQNEDQQKKSLEPEEAGEPEEESEIKTVAKTDYVLEGSLTLDVKIENDNGEIETEKKIEAQNKNTDKSNMPDNDNSDDN